MAILKIKDKDGNIIPIPAIKGEKGDSENVDVQVNGTSIVEDGIANIPVADRVTLGLAKVEVSTNRPIYIDANQRLALGWASDADLTNRNDMQKVITSYNYDKAVKAAMCDGKGAEWTQEEKASARARMGVDEWELVAESTLEQEVGYWYALDQDTLNKLVTYNRIKVQWDTNGLESENAQVWVFSNKISITIPKNQQSTVIIDLVKEPSGDIFTGTVTVYNPSYVYAGYSSSTQVRFMPTYTRFDHGGASTAKVRIGNSIKFWGCK